MRHSASTAVAAVGDTCWIWTRFEKIWFFIISHDILYIYPYRQNWWTYLSCPQPWKKQITAANLIGVHRKNKLYPRCPFHVWWIIYYNWYQFLEHICIFGSKILTNFERLIILLISKYSVPFAFGLGLLSSVQEVIMELNCTQSDFLVLMKANTTNLYPDTYAK